MFPPNMPRPGRKKRLHDRTKFRAEMAIRLELSNLGMKDAEIARHIGMTSTGYSLLKKTQYYINTRNTMISGILSDADADLYKNYHVMRTKLDMGVPIALENLIQAATQKLDTKLKFKASLEILDRHGRFSKVTRIGLPTGDQGNAASVKDQEVADDLIHELASAAGVDKNSKVVLKEPDIHDSPITNLEQ